MVDLFDLYACCLSSVNMFIFGVSLFVIMVAHILYMIFRMAIGLKSLRSVFRPLYIFVIIPTSQELVMSSFYVSLEMLRSMFIHLVLGILVIPDGIRPTPADLLSFRDRIDALISSKERSLFIFLSYSLCFIRYPYNRDFLLII